MTESLIAVSGSPDSATSRATFAPMSAWGDHVRREHLIDAGPPRTPERGRKRGDARDERSRVGKGEAGF
jgi:hypothetical protein